MAASEEITLSSHREADLERERQRHSERIKSASTRVCESSFLIFRNYRGQRNIFKGTMGMQATKARPSFKISKSSRPSSFLQLADELSFCCMELSTAYSPWSCSVHWGGAWGGEERSGQRHDPWPRTVPGKGRKGAPSSCWTQPGSRKAPLTPSAGASLQSPNQTTICGLLVKVMCISHGERGRLEKGPTHPGGVGAGKRAV